VIYAFGAYELDTDRFELRRGGGVGAPEPQGVSGLAHLLEHPDPVGTRGDPLDNGWGRPVVRPSGVPARIQAAPRAVGDDGQQQLVIKTVHGRGYRFVAPLRSVDGPGGGAMAGLVADIEAAGASRGWPIIGRHHELDLVLGWFGAGETGGVVLTGGA